MIVFEKYAIFGCCTKAYQLQSILFLFINIYITYIIIEYHIICFLIKL